MTKRNPKQEGSNLFDCKPQIGKCPMDCNECFYNRPGAFYVDINEPHMPTIEEVGDGIVRVNSGHDSNIERTRAIEETEIYPRRFFNTSIPKFNFPAPVVLTINPREEATFEIPPHPFPDNLMYVRIRVSSTNLRLVRESIGAWASHKIPIVLTFMAYYSETPDERYYEWRVRHINSYWCAKKSFVKNTLRDMKKYGGRLVTMCGTPDSGWCRDCRKCESYYWQTIEHMTAIAK